MKTQTFILCTHCNRKICSGDGVIIQGNVYTISENIEERPGLIGNAFPAPNDKNLIDVNKINEESFHHSCLIDIIHSK